MVWEELTFHDAVSYSQQGSGLCSTAKCYGGYRIRTLSPGEQVRIGMDNWNFGEGMNTEEGNGSVKRGKNYWLWEHHQNSSHMFHSVPSHIHVTYKVLHCIYSSVLWSGWGNLSAIGAGVEDTGWFGHRSLRGIWLSDGMKAWQLAILKE